MQVEITLKNYRCFSESRPAKILLQNGFIALVGINNSGKSSLLKFFYEFRSLFSFLSSPHTFYRALKEGGQDFNYPFSILDTEEVFCNANNHSIEVQLRFLATDLKREKNNPLLQLRVTLTIPRGTRNCLAKLHVKGKQLAVEELSFRNSILRIGGTTNAELELSELFQILKDLSNTLYVGAFRNAINTGSNQSYFDIQVGEAFIKSWRALKTGKIKRDNEATYRLTEDIKNIFGFKDLEINPSEDDKTLQVFINGKSHWLEELGSGIAQFIIVLANAATKQPSYILIDEPELNLHPSLQLDFLTTLGSYAQKGVLFATHSVGLARASADQVYSVHKVSEGQSEVSILEATLRLSEFLGELRFFGYRELGFDKILLVEGPTEVKTIQQFLRLYKKDHQIVLLPLGGGSLINGSSDGELAEIKRISDNIFALIDSERSESGTQIDADRVTFVKICNKLAIQCHVLERRATENYFPDEAVKKIKGEKYRALKPYEKLNNISPSWSKTENWKIAREITRDDLDKTDLGEFLRSL